MADPTPTKIVVVCLDGNGEAEFYQCIVLCTERQRFTRDHLECAKSIVKNDVGFEPLVAIDEHDFYFDHLKFLDRFDWRDKNFIDC